MSLPYFLNYSVIWGAGNTPAIEIRCKRRHSTRNKIKTRDDGGHHTDGTGNGIPVPNHRCLHLHFSASSILPLGTGRSSKRFTAWAAHSFDEGGDQPVTIESFTDSVKRASSSAAAKASSLEKDVETANKEKADLQAQLAEAHKRSEDLLGQQKRLEQDLKKAGGAFAKLNERRQLCENHNQELYRLGRELADWYAGKGASSAFIEAEPFTQLKSVEMKNLLETYRDKLEVERLLGEG